MKKKAREAVTTQLHIKEDQVDILLDFMFSGMLTVYQHWFNSDRRQSLEEISETLCVLCFHGLNGVLPEE